MYGKQNEPFRVSGINLISMLRLVLVICLGIYSATAAGLERPPATIEGDEIPVEVLGHSTSLRLL